jgi:hypothetical protein
MCIGILAKLNLRGYKPEEKKRLQIQTINDTISLTTPLSSSKPSPNSPTGLAKSGPKKRKTVTFDYNVVAYSEDNPADVADSIEPPDGERSLKRRESTTSWTSNSSDIAHSSTTNLSDSRALAIRLSKERYNLRTATINRSNFPKSTYSPRIPLELPLRPSNPRSNLQNRSLSPPRSQRATSSANDSTEGTVNIAPRCSSLVDSPTPASSPNGTPANHARQQESAPTFQSSAGGFRKEDHNASDADDERDSSMTEDLDT